MSKYDIDYFLAKFKAIPDSKWTTREYERPNGKCCALGHCLIVGSPEPEADALFSLVSFYLGRKVTRINDYPSKRFPQKRPRARILAALRAIKKEQAK